MHSLGVIWEDDERLSCADQPGYVPIRDGVRAVAEADVRVAHNGDDYDERLKAKLYPDIPWKPDSRSLDTILISRLLYPSIYGQGPNTFKAPPKLRMGHSLEAWGWRLGEKKDKEFDPGDWQMWSPDMSLYMMQDCTVLKRLFTWLMSRKPSQEAVELEHDFARIIRRQEKWGFGFDANKALDLQAELGGKAQVLEAALIETFGEWWFPSKVKTPTVSREVAMTGYPDITVRRIGVRGNELKPYIGPPKMGFTQGCPYTPVKYIQFQPRSTTHVERMLKDRYGWVPVEFTAESGKPLGPGKGRRPMVPKLDDEVLRTLPYPEAAQLADLYGLSKIWGYVSQGRSAWLKTAREHPQGTWRQHGRVNTIGTYTFRPSMSSPNMGQVPTRDQHYGPLCRSLFTCKDGYILIGYDGSGIQLRLMAHHMAKYDGGKYAQVFKDGIDPHDFMRDAIGTDLMGEGHEGRGKGKTIDYALPFGGGLARLGSIVDKYASEAERRRIGQLVKDRMEPTFGKGFEDLKKAIKTQVENFGYLTGLDGRKVYTNKAHTGLSSLLQMNESIVMRKSLVLLDNEMQRRGWKPGVDAAGNVCDDGDYEFTVNVYDEAQADVLLKAEVIEDYMEIASKCVQWAGEHFKLQCPLTSEVKVGLNWAQTH